MGTPARLGEQCRQPQGLWEVSVGPAGGLSVIWGPIREADAAMPRPIQLDDFWRRVDATLDELGMTGNTRRTSEPPPRLSNLLGLA